MNEILKKAIENFKKKQDKRFLSLRSEINTRIDIKNEELEEKNNENIVSLARKFGELLSKKVETIKKQIVTRHNELERLEWSKSGHIIDENLDLNNFKIKNLKDPVDEQDAVNVRTLLEEIRKAISKIRIPNQVISGGGESTKYIIKDEDINITNGDVKKIFINTDTGDKNAVLPANPGDVIFTITNIGVNGYKVIIDRNGNTINRIESNINVGDGVSVKLQYTTIGWIIIN